jgi:hypothetical protein
MFVNFCQLTQAKDSTSYCGTPDMDSTEFTQLPWFDNNDLLEAYLTPLLVRRIACVWRTNNQSDYMPGCW